MGWLKDRKEQRRASRNVSAVTPAKLTVPPEKATPTWPADAGRPVWMVDGMSATLYSGDEDLEVVGESFYQDALWSIVGRTPERVRVQGVAILIPEDGNQYDPDSVAVWMNGHKVGHLSRTDAAAMRQGIIEAVNISGRAVALQGVIVGGGPRTDARVGALGVWLRYDPADFGLPAAPAAQVDRAIRTGISEALLTDEADDSYDLSWMEAIPEAGPKRIAALRDLLARETQPISRHYLYRELEAELYEFRAVFPAALDEYDATTQSHDAEMHESIRQALVEKFGALPLLETYRQASIRHAKGGADLDRALWWAQRGLAVYGDDAHREAWPLDLMKRSASIQARIDKRDAPRKSRQAITPAGPLELIEKLVCQSCGNTFTRARTRGRKPHACLDCRAAA